LKTLTDYLDESTLKQLQDAFSAVVQSPILVCRPDGAPYVDAHSEPYDWDAALPGSEGEVIAHAKRRGRGKLEMHDIPIVIDGQCVGRVRMEPRHVDKTAPSTGGAVAIDGTTVAPDAPGEAPSSEAPVGSPVSREPPAPGEWGPSGWTNRAIWRSDAGVG